MAHVLDTPFDQAVAMFGGKEARLAAAAGVSQNAIWAARRAGRVSPRLAVKIEHATKGEVPRWKLCPDVFEVPFAEGARA